MKTIDIKFLKKHNACGEAVEWFEGLPKKSYSLKSVAGMLFEKDRFDWINWGIVRLMNKRQKVMYAIFAAEQVIKIYEKKHPKDRRPREAIEAAKAYLKNPCKKTSVAAADAAAGAAYTAASAAYTAAYTAADAAAAADADVAAYAADAAYTAADAKIKLQKKIVNYGIRILTEK